MTNFHDIADINLPFPNCSPFHISSQYQSGKNNLIEKLENNSFSKEMFKFKFQVSSFLLVIIKYIHKINLHKFTLC